MCIVFLLLLVAGYGIYTFWPDKEKIPPRQTPVGVNAIAKLFPPQAGTAKAQDTAAPKAASVQATGNSQKRRTKEDSEAQRILAQAKATDVITEKIRLFDEIIRRFMQENDYYSIDAVTEAAFRKADLADTAEKRPLYESLIARYENDSQYPAVQAVDEAYEQWTKLLANPQEQLALLDRRIGWLLERDDPPRLIDALCDKAKLVESPAEKKAIYTAIYADYGGSRNSRIVFRLVLTLFDWAEVTDDKQEKIRLYNRIVEECKYGDSFASDYAERAVAAKAKLSGNNAVVRNFQQRQIAESVDEWDAALKLYKQARRAETMAESRAIYDQVIERYSHSNNPGALSITGSAALDKADFLFDLDKRNAAYDKVIASSRNRPESMVVNKAGDALFRKALIATDRATALSLCDKALALKGLDGMYWRMAMDLKLALLGGDPEALPLHDREIAKHAGDTTSRFYLSALFRKARVLTDAKEKIELLDQVIALSRGNPGKLGFISLFDASLEKIDATENPAEKNVLCEQLITVCRESTDDSMDYRLHAALEKKKEVTGDSSALRRYFDDKIAAEKNDAAILGLRVRQAAECGVQGDVEALIEEAEKLYRHNPDIASLRLLVRAIIAQADFANKDDQKIAIYDEALARIRQYGENGDSKDFLSFSVMQQKMQAVADAETKLALCDVLIAKSVDSANNAQKRYTMYLRYAGVALQEKIRILREKAESLHDTKKVVHSGI